MRTENLLPTDPENSPQEDPGARGLNDTSTVFHVGDVYNFSNARLNSDDIQRSTVEKAALGDTSIGNRLRRGWHKSKFALRIIEICAVVVVVIERLTYYLVRM